MDKVEWSSEYPLEVREERRTFDRRESTDRRQYTGRSITVPDMRRGDRRLTSERRKVRVTITGRAMDI